MLSDLPRIRAWLGPERYIPEDASVIESRPGVAIGLAWTPHGGDILYVEASALPEGKGTLALTGQLGEVMKESAQIALSLVRSRALGEGGLLATRFDFHRHDLHIHVPSGAIPKDGPSAGVSMLVALASLISGQPVRSHLAMTGEVTLRGQILPVGGIKEKVLAAHRSGLKILLLPKRNEADLEEVPDDVRGELQFIFAESVDVVLAEALGRSPQPLAMLA